MIEEQKLNDTNEANQSARRSISRWLTKIKYYYDRYNCRYLASLLLLLVYSILGAWLFYLLEHENEKKMKTEEAFYLERLRNKAVQRIVSNFQTNQTYLRIAGTRNLLLWYENELHRVKLPEALEWDMWGALFYVGTILTTIGYGNIFPRTIAGRALSVAYAIIGIPLVLSVLAKLGRFLEHMIAQAWITHREHIKKARRETRKRLRRPVKHEALGSSNDLSPKLDEATLICPVKQGFLEGKPTGGSRTIPVWLALLICLSWICICAALFLIWERRWTFFTSLYFFFISLSTIGLGDVMPDHPHMLILMFWLVIAGLSIVSMLLTVIQIKLEECLYNMVKRIQEEYKRNMETGGHLDREEIVKRVMEEQPFLTKLFALELASEEQMKKIETESEQFERIMCDMNNKSIQTELQMGTIFGTSHVEKVTDNTPREPMSNSPSHTYGKKMWSRVESIDGLHSDNTFKESQAEMPHCDFDELIEHLEDLQYFGPNKPLDCYACISMKPVESHRMQLVTIKMDDTCCRFPVYAAADRFVSKTRSLPDSQERLTQVSSTAYRELISRDVGTVAESQSCNLGINCCRRGAIGSPKTSGVEISTQYSPPRSPLEISKLGTLYRETRSNLMPRGDRRIKTGENHKNYAPNKDAVVQTDDSYLKIARRLDEYRSLRTNFLPVFAAFPNPQLHNTSNSRRPPEEDIHAFALPDVQRRQLFTNFPQKERNKSMSVGLNACRSIDVDLERIATDRLILNKLDAPREEDGDSDNEF